MKSFLNGQQYETIVLMNNFHVRLLKNYSSNWNNKFGLLAIIIGLIIFIIQDDFSYDKANFRIDKHSQDNDVLKIKPISLAEFIIFRKNSKTICVDLRKEQFFNNGHIPRAINIPVNNFLSPISLKNLEKLKKAMYVIFYTNSNKNNFDKHIVRLLSKKGIEDIYFYNGGLNEWKACNMPVERMKGD